MRVLVTGGGGFIGSALVTALAARGDKAIAFDRGLPPSLRALAGSDAAVVCAEGDITDAASVYRVMHEHRPDAVVHAAALVGVVASLSAAEMIRVNMIGTVHVYEAMRLYGVGRVVHISSEETLGNFRADMADEGHPLDPMMPYGITKAAVEQLGRSYSRSAGPECINVRTSWVYGPDLPRPRIPKTLVEAAIEGRPLHLPTGASSRIDHTYIDDAVDGILRALDHDDHPFDVYNIASGRAPSVAELVDVIGGLLPGADLTVGPGELMHREDLPMVRKGALDISRARDVLGYSPRYDIERGLRAYVDSLKSSNRED